jgi:hypothetical protein
MFDFFPKNNRIIGAIERIHRLEAALSIELQSPCVSFGDGDYNRSEAILSSPPEHSVHEVNCNPLASVFRRYPDLQ